VHFSDGDGVEAEVSDVVSGASVAVGVAVVASGASVAADASDVPLLLDVVVAASAVAEPSVIEVDVELVAVLVVPAGGPVSGTQSLYTCHMIALSTPWNASQ
jgi:hypothetical protein